MCNIAMRDVAVKDQQYKPFWMRLQDLSSANFDKQNLRQISLFPAVGKKIGC